jgi:hypothetical protein
MADKTPALKLIDGGKPLEEVDFPITKADPKPPGGGDWLRSLPNHTRFVSRHKTNQGSRLDTWGIAAILPQCIMLYDFNNPMGPPVSWHTSEEFSRDNRFVAILPDPPKEEEDNEQHHLPQPEPREEHD